MVGNLRQGTSAYLFLFEFSFKCVADYMVVVGAGCVVLLPLFFWSPGTPASGGGRYPRPPLGGSRPDPPPGLKKKPAPVVWGGLCVGCMCVEGVWFEVFLCVKGFFMDVCV